MLTYSHFCKIYSVENILRYDVNSIKILFINFRHTLDLGDLCDILRRFEFHTCAIFDFKA